MSTGRRQAVEDGSMTRHGEAQSEDQLMIYQEEDEDDERLFFNEVDDEKSVDFLPSSLQANRVHSTASSKSAQQQPQEHIPQFHFSGTKAGMENIDKARMERIIAEVSKGNPYYEQAAKTDERIRERAAAMKQKAERLTAKDLSVAEIEVNRRVAHLEKTSRDMSRVIVVVDMDQFFVAVEMRDNPSLRDKPVAVGSTLISTANYEARKYGVRSAMPTFIGKKLCPELITVRSRMDAYSEASQRAQAVFKEYDANFSAMSLDEAYLDITGKMDLLNLSSDEGVALAENIVQEMRKKVCEATGGLTCSAGIAPNRMLAKICSEKNKPNGQFALRANIEDVISFVRALPVRKIPGIGKASELLLDVAFGVKSVQDLWEKRYALNRCLTPAIADFYIRVPIAATEGHSFFSSADDSEDTLGRKSISLERTFRAIKEENELMRKCEELCKALAEEIAEKNLFGRTLTLKLKTDAFEVRSRGETLKTLFGGRSITGAFLYRIAGPLLKQEFPISARLMGLRLSNLAREPANFDASVYRQASISTLLSKTADHRSSAQANHCPICSCSFDSLKCSSNGEINAHIDACLNLDEVSHLGNSNSGPSHSTSSSLGTSSPEPSKKPRIDAYFKKSTVPSSSSSKKHKLIVELLDDDD